MQVRSIALISVFVLSAGAALAHKYDANKPVTLSGTVGKIEWHKPYVKIHLDAKDTNGKTIDWEIETATPSVLQSDGFTSKSIKEGDQITVQADGAADGSHHALAHSVTLADGRALSVTAPEQQAGNPASPNGATLPQTATNFPLIGVIGLVALAASAGLSLKRRLG
jgi:LPXTG-motif cell wall-anchored protein